jgi:hypothetical protein
MPQTVARGAEWRIVLSVTADGEPIEMAGAELIVSLCTAGAPVKTLRVGDGLERLDDSTFVAVVDETDAAQTGLRIGQRNIIAATMVDSLGVTSKVSDALTVKIAEREPVQGLQ